MTDRDAAPDTLLRDLDRMGEAQALLARALLTLDGLSDTEAAERLRAALATARDGLEREVGAAAATLGTLRAERGLHTDD